MAGRTYRDLSAWQRAMDLVESVYRAVEKWPKDEQYGLTSQVRRAVVSIPANIAEGQGRGSRNEFLRFVMIANGSLYELETHIMIAKRIGYLHPRVCDQIMEDAAEVGRILHGLMRSLKPKTDSGGARSSPTLNMPTTDY